VCLPSLATGRLFDLGYFKVPFFAASCVLVTCTFLTAECTKFWQLFLTQGIGLGVGCGFVFSPAIVIVSHWFSKRRGLALSITAVGSALGSIVFPVAAQNLIPLIGWVRLIGHEIIHIYPYTFRFRWTVRVFGLTLTATMGTANIVCR
jgi:MFS family permease